MVALYFLSIEKNNRNKTFLYAAIRFFKLSKFPSDKEAKIGTSFFTASIASAMEAAVSGPITKTILPICFSFFNIAKYVYLGENFYKI